MTAPAGRHVRDRRVVLLLAGCVALVLGVDVLSGLVPELDRLLSQVPVLVIVLVVGTLGILVWSTRSRRPRSG